MKTPKIKDPTLPEYQDAVWDFLMEHCDITERGSLFVKFHMTGRTNLEKRIMARYKGYHREDHKAKEKIHLERVAQTVTKKIEKKKKYQLTQKEKRKAFARLKREITIEKKLGRLYTPYSTVCRRMKKLSVYLKQLWMKLL